MSLLNNKGLSKQIGPRDRIKFRREDIVSKGWGKEIHVANVGGLRGDIEGYCGKFLTYITKGATSSMHFHALKHETFYVLNGKFVFNWIETEKADVLSQTLTPGDIVEIPNLCPHQLVCVEPGSIIEFSSTDYSDDNFRVSKGDSQK